jgi:hypothetical protein
MNLLADVTVSHSAIIKFVSSVFISNVMCFLERWCRGTVSIWRRLPRVRHEDTQASELFQKAAKSCVGCAREQGVRRYDWTTLSLFSECFVWSDITPCSPLTADVSEEHVAVRTSNPTLFLLAYVLFLFGRDFGWTRSRSDEKLIRF